MAVEHGMGVEDVRDEQSDGRADQQDRTVQHAARRILHAGHQQRTEQQPDDRFAQPAIAQAERPARIGDAEHRPDAGEGQRHDAPAGDDDGPGSGGQSQKHADRHDELPHGGGPRTEVRVLRHTGTDTVRGQPRALLGAPLAVIEIVVGEVHAQVGAPHAESGDESQPEGKTVVTQRHADGQQHGQHALRQGDLPRILHPETDSVHHAAKVAFPAENSNSGRRICGGAAVGPCAGPPPERVGARCEEGPAMPGIPPPAAKTAKNGGTEAHGTEKAAIFA